MVKGSHTGQMISYLYNGQMLAYWSTGSHNGQRLAYWSNDFILVKCSHTGQRLARIQVNCLYNGQMLAYWSTGSHSTLKARKQAALRPMQSGGRGPRRCSDPTRRPAGGGGARAVGATCVPGGAVAWVQHMCRGGCSRCNTGQQMPCCSRRVGGAAKRDVCARAFN
jgi:hypothetical protein